MSFRHVVHGINRHARTCDMIESMKKAQSELAPATGSPFVVPPFQPPPPSAITYVWWSWHPCYPYWSQSCWKAATIEDAQKYLTDPRCSLGVYHNKLILHDGITLQEVQDVPCREMEVWHKIKRQMDEANAKDEEHRHEL